MDSSIKLGQTVFKGYRCKSKITFLMESLYTLLQSTIPLKPGCGNPNNLNNIEKLKNKLLFI